MKSKTWPLAPARSPPVEARINSGQLLATDLQDQGSFENLPLLLQPLLPLIQLSLKMMSLGGFTAFSFPSHLLPLASLTFMNTSVDRVPQSCPGDPSPAGLHPAERHELLGVLFLHQAVGFRHDPAVQPGPRRCPDHPYCFTQDFLPQPRQPVAIWAVSLPVRSLPAQRPRVQQHLFPDAHLHSLVLCRCPVQEQVPLEEEELLEKAVLVHLACPLCPRAAFLLPPRDFSYRRLSKMPKYSSELSSVYFFYNMVLVVLSLLLLFVISLTCRALLGAAIAKAAKKSSRGKKMKSRSLQMTKVSLVIFAVCFGSLHICRTIGIIAKYHGMSCRLLHQVEDAYYVSWVFTMSNTCLDPLIYLFANDKFKRSFADSFQKFWGTN